MEPAGGKFLFGVLFLGFGMTPETGGTEACLPFEASFIALVTAEHEAYQAKNSMKHGAIRIAAAPRIAHV